jgi:hypothetical protein
VKTLNAYGRGPRNNICQRFVKLEFQWDGAQQIAPADFRNTYQGSEGRSRSVSRKVKVGHLLSYGHVGLRAADDHRGTRDHSIALEDRQSVAKGGLNVAETSFWVAKGPLPAAEKHRLDRRSSSCISYYIRGNPCVSCRPRVAPSRPQTSPHWAQNGKSVNEVTRMRSDQRWWHTATTDRTRARRHAIGLRPNRRHRARRILC